MHLAVRQSHFDLVGLLLDHDANINLPTDDDQNPLHLGLIRNNSEIIELLVERGANLNIINGFGSSIIACAAEYCSPKIIR